ncbi:hypothetical protein D3C87_1607350 [compost metagenome]
MNQPRRMPPRISTGAAKPHEASRRLAQKGGRGRWDSSAPILYLRDSHTAGMISAKPASRPGIMPAANSAGTDAPGTSTE